MVTAGVWVPVLRYLSCPRHEHLQNAASPVAALRPVRLAAG